MRVFFSGDEEVCKRHLPVVQARANEFAKLTEKRGLKQNAFTYSFDDTGAVVRGAYVFGQMSVSIDAPIKSENPTVRERTFETKLAEWNYVYPIPCTGGGLGAFFSINSVLIPHYKDDPEIIVSDFIYADDTPWFDTYTISNDSSAILNPNIINNFWFVSGLSKSISHVVTVANGIRYGSVIAYQFDKVRSNIWLDGYSPNPAVILGANDMFFVGGGDYVDDSIPEIVTSSSRPPCCDFVNYGSHYTHISAIWKGAVPSGASPPARWAWLGYGQEGGNMGRGLARGDNIVAYFTGNQNIGSLEYDDSNLKTHFYKTLYEYDLVLKVFDGENLLSFMASLISDEIGRNNSFTSFHFAYDSGTGWSSTTSVGIAMNVLCAPRNTGFITGFFAANTVSNIGPQKLMSPSMYDGSPPIDGRTPNSAYIKVLFNFFTVQNGALHTGLVDIDIFPGYIRNWSYDGLAFLYTNVNYGHQYGVFTETGTYTIYALVLSGGLSLSSALTISGVTNPTFIWYSKNWDSIVVKGSLAEDGIYRLEAGTYAQIQDGFDDTEPVYFSPDGDIIITKQKIFRKGLSTINCTHCVGMFYDREHYVDRISDTQYAIKNISGDIISTTPDGLYNFHELSEEGTFAVLSKYYTNQEADDMRSGVALIVDFADGPIKFETTNRVLVRQLSASPRLGVRYWDGYGDYVAPPWCYEFHPVFTSTTARITHKAIAVTYADSMERRGADSPPTKRIFKHFWHAGFGVFERVLDTLEPVPENMLYRTETFTEEVE